MTSEAPAQLAPRDAGAAARAACSHCSLPVPAGLVEPGAEHQFCCGACRAVWEAIHGCGLERYYELRDRQGAEGKQAQITGRGYEEFDDPAFAALYCQEHANGVRAVELFLEGVHCIACVWLVEKLPELEAGVLEARLDLGRSMVRLTWQSEQITLSRIAKSLDRLGYVPHPAKGTAARDARRMEDRAFLTRLAIAGALAGNAMLLAGALYFGMFSGIEEQYRQLFRWTSMGLATVALVWPGRVFFRGALAALRTRTRHLDLPIAIGLVAGMTTSTVSTVLGTGEIYFDSITVLVFLLLCGRWVQHRQQRAATDAVELLYSLTPARARVWEAGETREVPIDAIGPGTLVEVRAEESFPADGEIVEGATSVDQSILTGESRPVEAGLGARVNAGSVNLVGRVLVRVEAAGVETRVGRLMRLVEDAALRRAPIVTAADRMAGRFVVAVITLALFTVGLWLVLEPGRPSAAIGHAMALLIVCCPCALGLATPLTVTAAIGRAARRGIMIKGGEVLERLSTPGTILLDKTGTITEGRQKLVRWTGDESVKPAVAAIESRSSHAVAVALSRELLSSAAGAPAAANDAPAGGPAPSAHTPSEPEGLEVQQFQGLGITGTVGGVRYDIGSPAFVLERLGATHGAWVREAIDAAAADAQTPVVVARAGVAVAVAALGDAIREDAKGAIEKLRADGWRVRILSGDEPAVVRAVGARLEIDPADAIGGASPEAKLAAVEAALADGPVVMVGDGVNDAAALARATVGVAVSGGAEASLAAADVYMRRHGLMPIVELCRGSRLTLRAIRTGLGASLGYNSIAATIAVLGLINALTAAVLMPLSSLTVLALALRARTFGEHACR
ncbi:MAG: heavy metal translocating P-type ATPase [Phycisphaerales bacterium]|nr:heavy metal translocating P-type ATPase [Phycisphaerales bacterium]